MYDKISKKDLNNYTEWIKNHFFFLNNNNLLTGLVNSNKSKNFIKKNEIEFEIYNKYVLNNKYYFKITY